MHNTSEIPFNFLSNKEPDYISINKNYFINFDSDEPRPSSIQYLGSTTPYYFNKDTIDVYNNTDVIYFNKKTIRNGGSNVFSFYNNVRYADDKLKYYMKDGFIHSLVHERIHDFISTYESLNSLSYFLRKGCVEKGIVRNHSTLEETVVTNTVNILFDMLPNNGGLSNEIISYYDSIFTIDIQSLHRSKMHDKLWNILLTFYNTNSLKKFSSSATLNSDINCSIFFLNFDHPDNIPTGPKPPLVPNTIQTQKKSFDLKAYKKQIEQRK